MAKAAAPKKAEAMATIEFFREVEQRSDEWLMLRRGIPTASKFSVVMAEGKGGDASVTRDRYMKQLAGEIITGQVAEGFRSEAMDRGARMEPEARDWYGRTRFVELEPIGFVQRTLQIGFGKPFKFGCSPDSGIVGKRKGLEIKSVRPDLLIDIVDRGAGGFPTEHKAQLQGTMACAGWEEMDLLLFYTGWPDPPVFTVVRSDDYIRRLEEQLDDFCFKLARMVEKIRNRRAFR